MKPFNCEQKKKKKRKEKNKESSNSLKNVIYKTCLEIIYLIYMYKKE